MSDLNRKRIRYVDAKTVWVKARIPPAEDAPWAKEVERLMAVHVAKELRRRQA